MKIKMSKKAIALGAFGCLAFAPTASQAAIVSYNVTQTYNQVVYDATTDVDTVFDGTFDFDTNTQTVSNLSGLLSQAMVESMSGTPTYVPLNYQLSSVSDGMGGLLVSTFAQNTSDVFLGGGFATGGTTTYGNENAYVSINLNLSDITSAFTPDQMATVSYADCTPGSLMGKTTCMTGWLGDGTDLSGGTMQGTYPIYQEISVSAVPVPAAVWLFGSGLIGLTGIARRRNHSGTKQI